MANPIPYDQTSVINNGIYLCFMLFVQQQRELRTRRFTVAATPPAALNGGSAATAASTTVTPSGTVTTSTIYLRGIVRVNAAGTFIPQLTQTGTSAAAIVGVNSFFRCWPIGSGSVTNIGNWS